MTDAPHEPHKETSAFEQLPLARADFPTLPIGQYRVYTDQKNFKLVQAISAVEALETSGFTQAFKIEREAMHKTALLAPNFHAPSEVPAAPPA